MMLFSSHGDSGGPLSLFIDDARVPHWVLIGIVSFGSTNCGKDGTPGLYTKVTSYLEWISNNIRD
jgi:secreted trypsin-like serine protease